MEGHFPSACCFYKDFLTSCNGQTITYDTIGNPLSYRNGMTFTWQNGRQLKEVAKNGSVYAYTYDLDGLRTSKTVGGITTTFYRNGTQLLAQKKDGETLEFLYDESGTAYGFVYNHTEYYYYIHNLQGDIIGILDSTGIQVVSYTYDANGNILTVSKNNALQESYEYDALGQLTKVT